MYRSAGIVFISLAGLASTFLIWVAGSYRYGALSTFWVIVGFKGLLAVSAIAYACSGGLLVDARRSAQPGYSLLLAFWLLTVFPFAFFLFILVVRFIHGGD